MHKRNRIMSLLLVILICIPLFSVPSSANTAIGQASLKALVNAEKLYPQVTGCPELDGLIDGLLKQYKTTDTYTKLSALYDWTVLNVKYSWEGYSKQTAPAYDKFALDYGLKHDRYVKNTYPEDMINRAYHSLTAKKGVCYDYAILFTVMARYIGIESYVRTGTLYVGSNWSGHHGWSVLKLDGKYYIFDPQQDNREKYDRGGTDIHKHFGIPTPASRWVEEINENRLRDAQLLPMTEDQYRTGVVSVVSSLSGAVSGGGEYRLGSTVTLTADQGKK